MKVEIILPLERETKGALLYRDQTIADRDPLYLADGLYIRKAGMAFAYGKPGQTPGRIKVTIEEID